VHPELLPRRDLVEGLSGDGSGFGTGVVVEHLDQVLISRSGLSQRLELNETRSEMRLGSHRAYWIVAKVSLIDDQGCLGMLVTGEPIAE
jgi:hypothetical protein